MKTCTKCGIEKPFTEYYFRSPKPPKKNGLTAICKKCKLAGQNAQRKTPESREAHREYWRTRYRDPLKQRARDLLHFAVSAGRIKRPEACEECGSCGDIHGHHDDYTKPLDVNWLCPPCHGRRHRKLNPSSLKEKP